jgi:glutathione synthase/RimK-type ligase-like ATP-grasp enzyme
MFSQGAKRLANALGVKRIKPVGSKYKGREWKSVINWGSSSIPPNVPPSHIYNLNAKNAQNKLQAFKMMSGYVDIPEWTESQQEAVKWLLEGSTVVCRTVLNGHSGNGIIIAETQDQLVDAPLYVKYFPKKEEYRVHVAFGEVILIQQKKKRKGYENANFKVRNHKNGFIYAVADVNPHQSVLDNATKAIEALKLDFGAVDVIWNEKKQKAVVLEVNTAPGLAGESSLKEYLKAFEGTGIRRKI